MEFEFMHKDSLARALSFHSLTIFFMICANFFSFVVDAAAVAHKNYTFN